MATSAAVFELLGGRANATSAADAFRLSSQLGRAEREQLCAAGATSFAVASDPWRRLAGVYMHKVVSGEFNAANDDVRAALRAMRRLHGLPRGARPSFSHFVRWLEAQANPGALSVHWMPEAVRCDAQHVPYSLVARQERLPADLRALAAALGWADVAEPRGGADEVTLLSRAALSACAGKRVCAEAIAEQVGAEWESLSGHELARRLYANDTRLPIVVGSLYQGDAKPFGYAYDL